MLRESLKIVWVRRSENGRIFFFPMFELKKWRRNIARCGEKGFRWGTYFSSCGSVFGFKKQHWAAFSSPLWTCIVNSTRTNFSPHWKKCSLSCRSVFGLKKHWDRFFSPLRTHAFWIYRDKVFCSCGSVFAQKQHWKTLSLWVFFWCEAAQDKVWNWEDLRLSGREVCRMKKIEELLLRLCENFALQISRLAVLSICVFANGKVWGGEGEKICRWEEDKILYWKKMRGWDQVEELKVFCQEYT